MSDNEPELTMPPYPALALTPPWTGATVHVVVRKGVPCRAAIVAEIVEPPCLAHNGRVRACVFGAVGPYGVELGYVLGENEVPGTWHWPTEDCGTT